MDGFALVLVKSLVCLKKMPQVVLGVNITYQKKALIGKYSVSVHVSETFCYFKVLVHAVVVLWQNILCSVSTLCTF